MVLVPKEKHKQLYKSLLNIDALRKRVLAIFVFLGIVVPNSMALAATTSITNDTGGTLPDNDTTTCLDRTFLMPDTGTDVITDVTITVEIASSRRDELDVSLISPQGTSVDLSSDNGWRSDNLYVIFDDAAATSITTDFANHTLPSADNPRKPEEALSTFDGENPSGIWTLHMCDDRNNGENTFSTATLNITHVPMESGLAVNFQMDECYWLGGSNGILDDVKDSSGNGLDAQSRNKADNIEANAKICRAGGFVNTYADPNESDAVFYPNGTLEEKSIGENAPFTVSAWLNRGADNSWMAAVIKVSDDNWADGWGLVHTDGSGSNIDFFVGNYTIYARAPLANNTWTHVVGTYDGSNIRIYTNGVLRDTISQNTYTPGALALSIGDDISGSTIDDRWQGNIDEVKIWNRTLTQTEILNIYNNENSGMNFDGTPRVCKQCNGSSITAGTWDLVGIPADSRTTPLTVNDVFGDDMNGTFGTDWKIYKRTYSPTDNSSGYAELSLTDILDFGQGYWLGSRLNSEWYVDGTPSVDYNSTNSACTASQCIEIDLTSVTKDFALDGDDGSGPYRYNMSGFTGMINPVDWADCRFIIDGTAYTPTDANASGFANKQIWLYNGVGTDSSNSYTTCDDTMSCKLIPFKGFWIELHGSTKNKTVKLLIPQE